MKRVVLTVLAAALVFSALGCGTIKGFGEDVQTVGRWVTKGSQEVEESVSGKNEK